MNKNSKTLALAVALALLPVSGRAQTVLGIEECRQMALDNNKELVQARTQVKMAEYDKKIARANYYPNVSVTGAYMYNEKNLSLIDDTMSGTLVNMGTMTQAQMGSLMEGLQAAIMSNPQAAQEFAQSAALQTLFAGLKGADFSEVLNKLGSEIDDAFHLDIQNIFVATASVQQPVFMGGKIVAANKIARLAIDLAKDRYDEKYQEVLVNTDFAYWQTVSIANKKRLAESYADLLHKMQRDVEISVAEGVATESDALQVKVKANEADMIKTKATNGLILAKMLLCKEIGLPLDSEIVLADENLEEIPLPIVAPSKTMDEIYRDRPETRSLDVASQIYKKKVTVARADMLPKLAVTANYMYSNPNGFNGFQNKFGGMFSAGVMLNIPIFHGGEALYKTRKAKAEATLYVSRLDDAKNLINLQVSQLRKQQGEAFEKLHMAESNLESAEENLRHASLGFEAGVITANTALAAHTAWLQAHSEYIDAGVELQMNNANLNKAEGNYKSDIEAR